MNIGTGVPTSIRKVAELVRAYYPDTTLLETTPPAGDPLGGYAATRRMEGILGRKPEATITQGVARYVKWLQDIPAAVPDWLRREHTAASPGRAT